MESPGSEDIKEGKFVPFVPFDTMFKLQPGVRESIPRQLQCVNCDTILEWRIYSIDPPGFDVRCPECHVTACDFWKDKVHRKRKDAY